LCACMCVWGGRGLWGVVGEGVMECSGGGGTIMTTRSPRPAPTYSSVRRRSRRRTKGNQFGKNCGAQWCRWGDGVGGEGSKEGRVMRGGGGSQNSYPNRNTAHRQQRVGCPSISVIRHRGTIEKSGIQKGRFLPNVNERKP
jgi:hypothetical protein